MHKYPKPNTIEFSPEVNLLYALDNAVQRHRLGERNVPRRVKHGVYDRFARFLKKLFIRFRVR